MGDYIRFQDGSFLKIGTCADNRYMRRSECERLAMLDLSGEARGNLDADPREVLWRFPWPDEDADGLTDAELADMIDKRNMFRSVLFSCPEPLLPVERHSDGTDFGRGLMLWADMSERPGAGCNVVLPCPARWGTNTPPHSPVNANLVRVIGERWDPAAGPRTIFECAWCRVMFAVDDGSELAQAQAAVAASAEGATLAGRLRPDLRAALATVQS